MAHLHFGFETVRNVSLSNSRCKRRTIRKRLKGQKKKGGKLPVDLVKLAKIAISPVLGKGLAELHTRPPAQCFRSVTGRPPGSLTSLEFELLNCRHNGSCRIPGCTR